jgi:hypothetical protein
VTPGDKAGPSFQHWQEWRELCALGRCAPETQACLEHFAQARFQLLVARYAHRTGVEEVRSLTAAMKPRDSWHLLESRFVANRTRRGKSYKDWLFARLRNSPDRPLDVVQGGATLIMRDAVREHLRREFAPPRTRSLDQPVRSAAGTPVTLAELLPDEQHVAEQAAQREYLRLAEAQAEAVFEESSRRERALLLARGLGISFNSSALEELLGRKKSVLSQAYRRFVEGLAARIRRLYPEEDGQALLTLSCMTLEEVTQRAIRWGKSERSLAALFLSVEEGVDAAAPTAEA